MRFHDLILICTEGLPNETITTERFLYAFSGHQDPLFKHPWASPYALSIYGSVVHPPGAGPISQGYGDGRAISIAEVLNPKSSPERWELQLKGAGKTPFARGGDGRAVVRSSVREFIASEAMYHLGIPTTRALSIITSNTETADRPWYTANRSTPAYFRGDNGGDHMQARPVAMVCRVSPSFIRVGTFELYSRRAVQGVEGGLLELRLLAAHTLKRDFPHIFEQSREDNLSSQLVNMAREDPEINPHNFTIQPSIVTLTFIGGARPLL